MLELSEGILLPARSQGDVKIPRASAGRKGKSLRDLTLVAGADPQVYRAFLHLMRNGELRCIAHEINTPKSIVIRTDC